MASDYSKPVSINNLGAKMLMVPNLLATAPLLHSSLTPGVFLNPPKSL